MPKGTGRPGMDDIHAELSYHIQPGKSSLSLPFQPLRQYLQGGIGDRQIADAVDSGKADPRMGAPQQPVGLIRFVLPGQQNGLLRLRFQLPYDRAWCDTRDYTARIGICESRQNKIQFFEGIETVGNRLRGFITICIFIHAFLRDNCVLYLHSLLLCKEFDHYVPHSFSNAFRHLKFPFHAQPSSPAPN